MSNSQRLEGASGTGDDPVELGGTAADDYGYTMTFTTGQQEAGEQRQETYGMEMPEHDPKHEWKNTDTGMRKIVIGGGSDSESEDLIQWLRPGEGQSALAPGDPGYEPPDE